MKRVFKYLKLYLVPLSKKYGVIGMYQRLIVYCLLTLIISLVASIVIELYHMSNASLHITFFQNYMIGIACSSFLALITAIVQFITTREKIWLDYTNTLFKLYQSLISITNKNNSHTNLNSETFLNSLNSLNNEFSNHNNNRFLFWFSIDKNERFLELEKEITLLHVTFITSENPKTSFSKIKREDIFKCLHLTKTLYSLVEVDNKYNPFVDLIKDYENL